MALASTIVLVSSEYHDFEKVYDEHTVITEAFCSWFWRLEALGIVLAQDSELIPVVQQGIRSRGFKGPIWGEQEQRLRHFHAELDRYLNDEK